MAYRYMTELSGMDTIETNFTCIVVIYTLFHEFVSTFFSNIIGLPERRNKRKSVLEITKMYYFKIQEINKMAIHTHVILRPRNAMFFLSNT